VSDVILKSLDVANFRSIRGHVHAPLDAKVVLVHGENGAGKTSLLSAIELALTGKVQSLERADPSYEKQLLHRLATEGSVLVRTAVEASERSFLSSLSADGIKSDVTLDERSATFFRKGLSAAVPARPTAPDLPRGGKRLGFALAQFVSKLLGLDRLDALENGLKPFADVRNVRKNVDGWLVAENEKSRLDRLLFDQRKVRELHHAQIESALGALKDIALSSDSPWTCGRSRWTMSKRPLCREGATPKN